MNAVPIDLLRTFSLPLLSDCTDEEPYEKEIVLFLTSGRDGTFPVAPLISSWDAC
jgi:hypothetical protein